MIGKYRVLLLPLIIALISVACGSEAAPTDNFSQKSSEGLRGVPPSTQGSVSGAPAQPAGSDITNINVLDRKIAYNASIYLTVKDTQDSIEAVNSITKTAGGFIASTNIRFEGERRVAAITIKVPATKYEDVMRQLRSLAIKVESESANAKDVTEQYTDLQARLRNLEATETQYLNLLNQAKSIDDIVKVTDRLSQVRGQIEQIKGQINLLDRTTELATIDIRLIPEGSAISNTTVWEPLKIALEAWESSLEVLRALATAAIAVAVFLWWLWPLVIIGIILLMRRRRAAIVRRPPVNPST